MKAIITLGIIVKGHKYPLNTKTFKSIDKSQHQTVNEAYKVASIKDNEYIELITYFDAPHIEPLASTRYGKEAFKQVYKGGL